MSKIHMKCLHNENVELKGKVEGLEEEKSLLKKKLKEVIANRDDLLA